MTYSVSTNEENYYGLFTTREEAIAEGVALCREDGRNQFWIGEVVSPPAPEYRWTANEWLEDVACQEEYSGEWAEGWDKSTKDQRDELEVEVHRVMGEWLDRHDLRPKFVNIDNAEKITVPIES